MKKAVVGMVVVLTITLGLASPGESRRITATAGCVKRIRHSVFVSGPQTNYKTFIRVRNVDFYLTQNRLKAVGGALANAFPA